MAASDSNTTIIGALISAASVVIAWIFRYKIAGIGGRKAKTPTEVLVDGYEKLLKKYQENLDERDRKIVMLSDTVDHAQDELDKAKGLIYEMKQEDQRKASVIATLEEKLQELKALHSAQGTPA